MSKRIPFSSLSLSLPTLARLTELRNHEIFEDNNSSWNIFINDMIDFIEEQYNIVITGKETGEHCDDTEEYNADWEE